MYAIVKNWEIQEFLRTIPSSTATISGLDRLSDVELLSLWYYKVIGASQPLKEWQNYWQPSYKIGDDNVIETKEIVDMSLEDYKIKKINNASQACQSNILKEFSEIDQLNLLKESMRRQYVLNMWWEVNNERVQYLLQSDQRIEDRRSEYKVIKESIQNANSYEEVQSIYNEYVLPFVVEWV